MPKDLHELSHLSDSMSYLYVERAIVERDENAIVILRANERIPVPVSSLTTLMLGPGTNVTHAAMRVIADNGCLVIWCGEGAMRFYGYGMGETRSAERLLRQAECCMDEEKHMQVVRRMFAMRFPDIPLEGMTLRQIRGLEGVRVRETYRHFARKHGIAWHGRIYDRDAWDASDELNRALSAANACLYGLCNAAIISLGYSPGLGFIHTGKLLSFVYDIADLYKMDTSIPAAFEVAGESRQDDVERAVRILLRKYLREQRILKRIAKDLDALFAVSPDEDPNRVDAGALWQEDGTPLEGGVNYAEEQ